MIKIGIAGATGYTGAELMRLLSNHPEASITALTSERSAGAPISQIFPSLAGLLDLECESLGKCDLEGRCDLIFSALPHREGMEVVAGLVRAGKRVIDLSADFRLKDAQTYEDWYGVQHTQKDLLASAVYGLPEIHRDSIKGAQLVANPGCYPTGAILGLMPLLKTEEIKTSGIIIDSKSGTSGAGRNAGLPLLFPECNEGVRAYSLGCHRHTPEMEQELTGVAGTRVRVVFSPHLVPVNRGILTTAYCHPSRSMGLDELMERFRTAYAGEPFIRLLGKGKFANTRYVLGANYCHIGLCLDEENEILTITTAIDNLVKGASGQAVQNMNLMFGLPEDTGLKGSGIFP